ncbi:hypothetical protein J4421_05165 [Candidatus Woesearchaeota archaeon]|nr:hypothetical protein [Candidatus Woesearchaeota archaeon]
MDTKQAGPYLMIVAIVAVVAIVFLVMNSGKRENSGTTEASVQNTLAGQASTGFLSPTTTPQIFVSYDKIKNSLSGSYPGWESTFSGNKVCGALGYSGCVTAFFRGNASYYASNNRACTNLQLYQFNYSSANCQTTATGLPGNYGHGVLPQCITFPWGNNFQYATFTAVEPYLGDVMHSSTLRDVICLS